MAYRIPYIFGKFNYAELTHKQRITRLYRESLVNMRSYTALDVELTRRDAVRLRYLIEENRKVTDPRKVKAMYEKWVIEYEKYKHHEPMTMEMDPQEGLKYDWQPYIPIQNATGQPEEYWWVKEWQIQRGIEKQKEWEWDKRPAWRSLITRNDRRSHLMGYEDDHL